jgi:hypothetical protein
MSLREDALLGCVDVHEEKGRVAERGHHFGWDSRDSHVIVKGDDAPISRRYSSLDRGDAGRRIVRAERLHAAT